MAVWNTDVKQNTTIADRSGGFALEFMANRQGAMETDYRPVETGAPYRFVVRMQTSLNGANDTVEVTARWYTSAKVLIGAPVAVHASAILSAAGVWDTLSTVLNAPATAAFATVRVEKDDVTTAYIAYCDFASVEPSVPAFWVYLDDDTDYGTGDIIVFDVDDGTGETYNFGDHFDTATGLFTAPSSDLYSFVSMVLISNVDLDTGEIFVAFFDKNAGTIVGYGTRNLAINDNEGDRSLVVSGPIWLERGDTIGVSFAETHAGDITILGDIAGIPSSYFGGARVGG